MTGFAKRGTDKKEIERVNEVKLGANARVQNVLEQYGSIPLHTGTTLSDLIRRPELDYDKLAEIDTDRPDLPAEVTEQVNILIKYDGYISRQIKQVEKFKKLEKKNFRRNLTIMKFRDFESRHNRS